jgi:voltage-gated potassium channel
MSRIYWMYLPDKKEEEVFPMSHLDPIKFRFRIYCTVFLSAMVIGTAGFMLSEDLSFIDSLYFSIVTVATVGYGDIHPATEAGKFFAVILIIMGVGTFLGVVASATEMMLNRRERESLLKKLNIIVGVFYSEVGTRLLFIFSQYDSKIDETRKSLNIHPNWGAEDYAKVRKALKRHAFRVEAPEIDFKSLKQFLMNQRLFMVGLLENPILVENEGFTDVLRAVFHLTEELDARPEFDNLPKTDLMHLIGDMNRAYSLLIRQWLDYMGYLKTYYPYLFSLAIRINPFNVDASPIVQES